MATIILQPITNEEGIDEKQSSYTPALIVLGVLYFMMGLITCLNDTLVPFFKKGFTLSYSQSSLVQFYFFLTYAVMSIPAGKLIERIGYKKGMVLGFSIAAIGAILFLPASIFHFYELFLAALFVVAIGIVLLQVAANPYVTILGPAKTASSRLAMVQGVGSIGTTVAPVLGAYFILSRLDTSNTSSEALRIPYLVIAGILVVIALVVSRLKLPVIKQAADRAGVVEGKTKSIFAFRNLNYGTVAIFLYVGAEVSIGTFLTNYVSDILKLDVKDANSYVAFYWGSMVIGRLLGTLILKTVKPGFVLAICASMAVMLILVSVNTSGLVAVWSMIAIGLFNSVMFAIIFSLSVNGLGTHTTRASGILSTAIVGGAVMPFMQGMLIDHFTWTIAFMLPLSGYLFILFYGLNGYRSKYNLKS